jgi:GH3 auxin-responsive promoter
MKILGTVLERSFRLAHRFGIRKLTPIEYQAKTLRRLLKRAQQTAFGQHYRFEEIINADDMLREFQERIPLFDYDKMHDQWWHRALNNEENVSWRDKTEYFALSSGTSGAPSKYIPMTDDMVKAIRRGSLKMLYSISEFPGIDADFFSGEGLLLSGSVTLKEMQGYFAGDMSGINIKKTPFWLRRASRPGKEIAAIPDWNRRLEEIAKNALEWDITYICGIPSWVQLMIEKVVEHHKVRYIHDVWPNLKMFVHGGIAFEPHRKSFEALMKKPITYVDTYLASEGFIAYQSRLETNAMKLILNNGIFHEFIPFNEQNFDSEGNVIGNPKAYTVDDIEEDMDYALVMSTCAGAWRYLIGDTVRFTDDKRKELIITGRTKHFLSVCGEHISVDNMNQAIQHLQNTSNMLVGEYTVAAVQTENGNYAHRWYIGCDRPDADAVAVATMIDEKLKAINDDYATERSAVLGDVQVYLLPTNVFHQYLASKGKIGGQGKVPRVMKKTVFAEWEAFVAAVAVN